MDQLPPLGMEVEAEPVVRTAQIQPDQLLTAASRSLLPGDTNAGHVVSRVWQNASAPNVYDAADELLNIIDPPGEREDDTGE